MREDCPLQFHLAMHPEIERVRLVWLWPFRSVSCTSDLYVNADMERTDMVQISEGYVYDTEYTFIGSSADVIRYLDEYGCWDDLSEQDISDAVENGELRITERCDIIRCYGNDEEYDETIPDPDIIESMRTFIVPSGYLDSIDQRKFGRICYDLWADL